MQEQNKDNETPLQLADKKYAETQQIIYKMCGDELNKWSKQ